MTDTVALHRFSLLEPHAASLVAGCSGRGGGVSAPPYDTLNVGLHVGDDPAAVIENRARIAQAIGAELDAFVIPEQIHRATVQVVTAEHRGRGARVHEEAIPATDALITQTAGVVLAVMVADCVPVIVFDPLTPAVGVAHAGWAGTVRHVARNTVAAMASHFGSDPGTLLAAIGPSIGPASYEVGRDVAAPFMRELPGTVVGGDGDERFLLDLWSANAADLAAAGVPAAQIEIAGLDTFQLPDQFFSHRRRAPTGRSLALAMLRG